jgi:hypothetical protein
MAGDSIRAQWVLGVVPQDVATVYPLDGRRCRTKAELLAHWAERLKFPIYFGQNWDAFEECLAEFLDRDSSEAGGLVLRIEHAADLLANDRDADLVILVDIVRSLVERTIAAGRLAVAVELIDEVGRLASLRERLTVSR